MVGLVAYMFVTPLEYSSRSYPYVIPYAASLQLILLGGALSSKSIDI